VSDPAALLARSVVEEFGGKVRFVEENYGDSELAARLGVRRYPAIFVDDVIVATPKDFGFYGKGEGEEPGRYAPLKSAASHTRFRTDLSRVVSLMLAGRTSEARGLGAPADTGEVAALPSVGFQDLNGQPVSAADLAGRVVLVDFWATWCPPCRGTLTWLGSLKQKYGDRIVVLALAVESDEADVRQLATSLNIPLRWAMRTPAVLEAYGDVSAVPTLLMFDQQGKAAGSFYGSSGQVHADAEAMLATLAR
jgi:cytochrome c biogenesis protein CcmG/thiol:disulfide interchange protein DsbE